MLAVASHRKAEHVHHQTSAYFSSDACAAPVLISEKRGKRLKDLGLDVLYVGVHGG